MSLTTQEKVGRASKVVTQSEAHTCPRLPGYNRRSSWPEPHQNCTDNASPRGCLPPLPACVCETDRPSETVGGILAQHSRRRWESPSPTPSPSRRDPTLGIKPEGSLAARYDFATSLRTPWRTPSIFKTPSRSRTNTQPSSRPNSVPWPQSPRVACGSSPDKVEISLLFPDCDHHSDGAITLVPSLRRSSSGCGSRNHIRGGIIELSHGPAVKRTPPTSPFGSPALPTVPLSTLTPPAHSQAPP
jgi:hypothetical protein